MSILLSQGLAGVLLLVGTLPAQEARGTKELDAIVKARAGSVGEGVRVAVWLGGNGGETSYGWDDEKVIPTASAIKTAILVELFARFATKLDDPVTGGDAVLDDDAHPMHTPFTPAQRKEIRKGLRGTSVRRLGAVMMGKEPASNIVYNAAASLSIAVLGGPKGVTQAIASRDRAFASIVVNRYMLTDRKKDGDNNATPRALGAVLQGVATGTLRGLDAATHQAIRDAMLTTADPRGQRWHVKDGALDTDPITRVATGFGTTPKGLVVFVVMSTQDQPGKQSRAEAGAALDRMVHGLGDELLKALQTRKP